MKNEGFCIQNDEFYMKNDKKICYLKTSDFV